MTGEDIDKIRREEPRAFDAMVAERLYGWRVTGVRGLIDGHGEEPGVRGQSLIQHFASKAQADYAVLAMVRGTWAYDRLIKFMDACVLIWKRRGVVGSMAWATVQVGDYSAAALAVVLSESPKARDAGGCEEEHAHKPS